MRIFGFAGYSGSGKTTLIEKLIPVLAARGLRVSLIKHAHHNFDVDKPGKDSYRHREAGCAEVLVTSSKRFALMHELRGAPEPSLEDLVARLSLCDIVLVEGFKHEQIPKLEVHRGAAPEPGTLFPHDTYIVGIATDVYVDAKLPCFDLDDISRIADFVMERGALLPMARPRLVHAA